MAVQTRSYAGNRFYLELDKPSGWLFTAEGGQPSTDLITERLAGGYPSRKHVGIVKFDDMTITCGTGMTEQFYQWLQQSLRYEHQRRNGAVVSANYDYKEVARQDFHQALITEIGFPGLDASSKDTAKFNIKYAVEWTEMKYSASGQSIRAAGNIDPPKQKLWTIANFQVQIDGLEQVCKRVTKVEAITIKQTVVENQIGERLVYEKEPAQIDFPNLVLTVPEADIEPWYKWHHDVVVKGKSDKSSEKGGHLEYKTSNLAETLFRLDFKNMGPLKFTPDKLESANDKIRYVKVELYCEHMDFQYFPKATYG